MNYSTKEHWDKVKERFRSMLLEDLKHGKLEWWYISVASEVGEGFKGGYVIQARGPNEAWNILHSMGWGEQDCSTQTFGPFDEEVMRRVPEDQRWRRLSKEEALNLGK